MLDLRRLRVLCEIAERGSFSASASALGYTQSAVSHQIATLEREVGMTLVERGTRPVRLTEAGTVLATHAQAALDSLQRGQSALDDLAGLRTGRLAVAAFPSACATLVPDALALLRARHPDLVVTLDETDAGTALGPLRRGQLDVALVFADPEDPPPAPPVQAHHLFDDPWYVQVPAGHPLARRRSVELATLADARWIAPSPQRSGAGDFRTLFERICERSGFRPRVVMETEDRAAGQGLVAAGIGLLPSTAMTLGRLTHAGVAILRLRGVAPARTISALTIAGRDVPAARTFVACLRAAARER